MTSPFSAIASSNSAAFFAFLFRENMQPKIGKRTSITMTPPAAIPAQTPISSLTMIVLMGVPLIEGVKVGEARIS